MKGTGMERERKKGGEYLYTFLVDPLWISLLS